MANKVPGTDIDEFTYAEPGGPNGWWKKIRDTLNAVALNVQGKAAALVTTAVKAENYAAAANELVPVDASAASRVVTLPNAPADGTRVGVKQILQSGLFTTSITCSGTDVFNKAGGATTIVLSLLNQGIIFQYKASTKIWYASSDDLPLSGLDARFARVLIREVGDATVPADFPAGGLVFSKEPLTLRKFDGLGLPENTALSTTVRGMGDNAFSLVNQTVTFFAADNINIPTSGSGPYFAWDGLTADAFSLRFYFRNEAADASQNTPFLRGYDAGSSTQWSLFITPTNQIQLRNNVTSAVFSSPALTLNKTYRVEMRKPAGSSLVTLDIYDLAGTPIGSTVKDIGVATPLGQIRFGRLSSVVFGPCHISHVALTDSFLPVGEYYGVKV